MQMKKASKRIFNRESTVMFEVNEDGFVIGKKFEAALEELGINVSIEPHPDFEGSDCFGLMISKKPKK